MEAKKKRKTLDRKENKPKLAKDIKGLE